MRLSGNIHVILSEDSGVESGEVMVVVEVI